MDKKLLDLYSDYLISSFSQTTATGLSRLLDGTLTHDAITNFLSETDFTSQDLWMLVKKDVRAIESEDGVLIFDDTIQEKPSTDENEIVCYHWDHTKGRNVKGINLLNCLYHNRDVSLPLGFDVIHKSESYVDPKDQKTKRRSTITKNELMRAQLRQVQQNQIAYRYVLTDIWFAANENMTFIKLELKKDFIMAFKSNRMVALSKEAKLQGRFVSIESLQMQENQVLQVYVKGLNFPVLLTQQVFTNKDGSEGILYLVCSDLDLSGDRIRAIYQKRWKVEEFHKSIKSNTGLAKSPTRVVRTQTNHFFASIYAFVKLERLRISQQMNHFALKSRLYLNAIKAAFLELNRMQPDGIPSIAKTVHVT
ncbi:MAG: transposase [SAR324 cluster bacterium]|nr:transposase [SAR324 cluster bacterium]